METIGNRTVHPVPALPSLPTSSPAVVRALDRIRFELRDSVDPDYSEFTWFAREYPRCYRHHLECAEYRLSSIHSTYTSILEELAPEVAADPNMFGTAVSGSRVKSVYWDFESYLLAVNSSLDLLARIAGTAYASQMPINFNKFCKKGETAGPMPIMSAARLRWVLRMKSYRDCFTHFTPAETMLEIGLVQYQDGFHMRASIPANPGVREILGFRYNRRAELLRYACTVWRYMSALDRAVADNILAAYGRGDYPARTTALFFVN